MRPELWFWVFMGAVLVYEWRQCVLGRASRHWRPMRGRVLRCIMQLKTAEEPVLSRAHLLFEYRVKSRTHRAGKIAYGLPWSRDYRAAFEYIRGLRPGQELPIRVNPRRPSQAVAIAGYAGSLAGLLCLTALLTVVFIARVVV